MGWAYSGKKQMAYADTRRLFQVPVQALRAWKEERGLPQEQYNKQEAKEPFQWDRQIHSTCEG